MLTEPAPRPEVASMHRNARRLLNLITQLLDIARLEAGSMTLVTVPTDLARTVRATVAAFAPLAQARDITLTLEPAGPVPVGQPLYTDADKLEQILYNLLSNALKFTPAGGQVTVAVRYSAEYATVVVRDTGIGIAPEELPRVFERFHQADAGRTRQRGGSGVGLALVRELVALHGGTASAAARWGRAARLRCAWRWVPRI
jgi:signal transduction histidine kinase